MMYASSLWAQPVRDRVVRTDVVELIGQNKDVAGQAEFAAVHGKFTYWFASEANMMTFLMNQDKYEVQLGGACARMGPLSGEGTTKLLATHQGRLYMFASEQCRARFLETPQEYLEADDPAPPFTDESRKRGRALLGKAVDAIACVAGLDNVITYHEQLARDEESGGVTHHVTESLTLAFPGKIRRESCWDQSCWAYLTDGNTGRARSSGGIESLHPQQIAALRRETTHPFTILRARDAKDMIITAEGESRTIIAPDGEVRVELVTVHRMGVTATLGIDEHGRIRCLTFRSRGPSATLGTIERIYSNFHDIGGLSLPRRVDATFNGKPLSAQSGAFTAQIINDPTHLKLFDEPIQ